MGNLRGWELPILLAIVLLLFGARRLPDLARGMARSMRIFKSEVKNGDSKDGGSSDATEDGPDSAEGAPDSAPSDTGGTGSSRTASPDATPSGTATSDSGASARPADKPDDGERPRS